MCCVESVIFPFCEWPRLLPLPVWVSLAPKSRKLFKFWLLKHRTDQSVLHAFQTGQVKILSQNKKADLFVWIERKDCPLREEGKMNPSSSSTCAQYMSQQIICRQIFIILQKVRLRMIDRHSCCPDNESSWLLCSLDFSSNSTMRLTFLFLVKLFVCCCHNIWCRHSTSSSDDSSNHHKTCLIPGCVWFLTLIGQILWL